MTRLCSWSSLLSACLTLSSTVFSQDVDSFISTQGPIAKAGLLANIGPSGSKSSGAAAGIVIASPSTSNPDYLFTWIRDSSLVYQVLIDQYASGQDTSLKGTIDDFVTSQTRIQQVSNPSGTVSTGGLGEPKFHINITAFTDPWGRPQRDGPALRSSSLITYANHLRSSGNTTWVTQTLWPVIKLDLDYVKTYWNQSGFDLWEEINSSSFWTTAVQHKALRQGIALANAIGDTSSVSEWQKQADNLLCFLNTYYTGSYILSNTGGGRSGLDANSVLASLHTFDPDAGCDSATFQPCSDKALQNLFRFVNSFRGGVYGLNSGKAANAAVAIGRYSEDVYFNGNPWYLTTLAVAEQLYDALYVWNAEKSLTVTSTSLPFFQSLVSSASTGTFSSADAAFSDLTSAVKTFADGFVSIVAQYTPSSGALAEQFDKSTGSPLSAADLTWSYASAVTAFNARANLGSTPGIKAQSWGAKGLKVPTTCESNQGPTVQVTFVVEAQTVFGENIFITGGIPALSNWDPNTAIALKTDSSTYPKWTVTVTLPATTNIEYKYIRKDPSNNVSWESDPNRTISTPENGTFTENDTWR